MKKLKMLSVLFLSLILVVSCSDNENDIENNVSLLTKKVWLFKEFKFLDSSLNPKNFSSTDFENHVNSLYESLTLKFNNDNTGLFKKTNSEKEFSWVLLGDKLVITIPNPIETTDDVFEYSLSIESSILALTMKEEFTIFIKDSEVSTRGVQYYN